MTITLNVGYLQMRRILFIFPNSKKTKDCWRESRKNATLQVAASVYVLRLQPAITVTQPMKCGLNKCDCFSYYKSRCYWRHLWNKSIYQSVIILLIILFDSYHSSPYIQSTDTSRVKLWKILLNPVRILHEGTRVSFLNHAQKSQISK